MLRGILRPMKSFDRSNESEQLFDSACAAWDSGDSQRAFQLFFEAARLGDAGAQLNLGHFFDTGEGVERSVEQAMYWYKSAWRSGETCACSNIAMLYAEMGQSRRAISWWSKAAALGDGDAALDLARFMLIRSSDTKDKVFNLLSAAVGSKNISDDGMEKAQMLLDVLFESRHDAGR